ASTIGDVADCLEVLEEGYDLTAERAIDVAPGKRMLDVEAFFFLIQAFSRQDDIHGAVEQFEYMKSLGIRPTTLVYNLMIGLYARRVDVSSAMSLLSTMREEGVRPDKVTFNSLLHMFVKRKDPTSALATAKAMIEQGCRPDMFTYVTLMDAYVEVGEWESAIRIYRYMRDSGDPTLKPNTAACNTVLKVYLLRPSPVQDVMSVVEDMKRASVQLNSRTFALMLQSACDAGLMKMAEEIFTEAEKSLPPVNGRLVGEGANMYHFSIMINAYLKMGNLKEAREYFDEMRRRGMEPGPITWSMLMSSYVSSGNEANFELARQLVVQLVAEEESPPESRQVWDSPSLKQGPPFESLFLPLLIARAKRNEPDLAEKVFEDLQSSGSNVSIQSYTALLDAYRRAGEVEAALRLWERMYSDVLRMSSQDLTPLKAKPSSDRSMTSRDGFKDPLRRNLICLPLSIMVELLTRAERFDEIASIWSRAKSDGFGFDPHNWNHLAVALCKSGRLREALNVIENVLPVPAPNWEAIRRQHEENLQHPSADDTSGQGAATEEGEEDEEEKEGGQGPVEKVETERGDVKEKEEERLDSDRMGDSEELDDFNRVETPIRPPNRRGYDRIRDDPFTILPFD
ncbi:TPR-like protein, partial [Violaceomyces palustris]